MTALRVAVWGLGTHAVKNIVPALQHCPGATLYGVCSRNTEVVARVANDARCVGWTAPEAMLDDPAVDAVYLSTPIALHETQGKSVLLAGKHLWCEKPFGMNAEATNALLTSSRDFGLSVGEGFMYLYHPHFLQLVRVLKAGRLGEVRGVSCRFGIPPLEHPGFRSDRTLGGGSFLDVGCYPVSAMVSLFPELEPDVLSAEVCAAPGSSVDNHGWAVLRYDSGVHAMLEWGTDCAYRNEIDIWGTGSSVSSERLFSKSSDHVPRFRFLDGHGNETWETGEAGNHFTAMFGAFRALVDDPASAESERLAIAKRARLMDRIRLKSTT